MRPTPPVSHSPLLTDEELDALIQAFNRRESTPGVGSSTRVGLTLLVLTLVGLGWWWY